MKIKIAAIAALASMTATAATAQQPQRSARPDQAAAGRMQSAPNEWNGEWRRGPADQHGRGGDHHAGRPGRGGPGMGMGMMRDPAKLFGAMDSDRNGSVSRPEFDRFHAQMRSRMEDRMHRRMGPDGRGPDGRGPGMQRPDGKPPKR